MKSSGLTSKQIKKIKRVFAKYDQIDKILIYGSRAKGNHKPASDIDLTLIGEKIDLSLLMKIEFDLDDLMLPLKFDLTIYKEITNPEFLEHINRVGKEFYNGKNDQGF